MSPEAQCIAIAEACEWIGIGWNGDAPYGYDPKSGHQSFNNIPDYLTDLNAMHEAEKTLTEDFQREQFRIALNSACGFRQAWKDSECKPEIVHATAAQRAEAFLRTIGKWVES